MRNFIHGIIVVAAYAAISPYMSAAPTVQVAAGLSGAAVNRPYGSPYSCGYTLNASEHQCSLFSSGILTENSSNWDSWYGLQNTFSGYAHTAANDAGLHAKLQLDVFGYPLDKISPANHYGSSYLNEGFARANFYDTLTPIGPGSGWINMVWNFDIDGQVYAFGKSNAYAQVSFLAGAPGGVYSAGQTWKVGNPNNGTNTFVPVNEHLTYTLSVKPGQAFQYVLELKAIAGLSDLLDARGPRLSTTSAVADFDSTLKFAGISFTDSQGNPLSGFSVQSQSGYNYNQFLAGVSDVPEPASMVTAGGALLIIGLFRRRGLRG